MPWQGASPDNNWTTPVVEPPNSHLCLRTPIPRGDGNVHFNAVTARQVCARVVAACVCMCVANENMQFACGSMHG